MIENIQYDRDFFKNLFEFKPSKGELKRLEIIKAAIDCYATLGFDKTTYESIALKIGTRRAHVNYYFKDKEEIFTSCIKYIMWNYQKMSGAHLDQAKTGHEMLLHYVEAPYLWANAHPKELVVMLLFYYFCSFHRKYKKLQSQIREAGVSRISYILEKQLGFSNVKSIEMAKVIQNSISGFMIDGATTKNGPLKKDDNIKFVMSYVGQLNR